MTRHYLELLIVLALIVLMVVGVIWEQPVLALSAAFASCFYVFMMQFRA